MTGLRSPAKGTELDTTTTTSECCCDRRGSMISNPTLCDDAVTVGDLRRFFLDRHRHAAVIVREGVLIAVIERSDLHPYKPDDVSAAGLGSLEGRVTTPAEPLTPIHQGMLKAGQHRLAVIDRDGKLLGMLCLEAQPDRVLL